MSARAAILSKVRASLGGRDDDGRADAANARLAEAQPGIIPARGQLKKDARLELFSAQAAAVSATMTRVKSYGEIAGAVTAYLRSRNLPMSVRVGADKRLAKAGWSGEKTLEVLKGASGGHDMTGVSHAFAGIAETGTVALLSGPDNPTTLNFLPEHHIVVVSAKEIEGDMEAVWAKLRKTHGKGVMPRALNLVTGPSRSGDIEQTILLGAHGPRALHLIIVE